MNAATLQKRYEGAEPFAPMSDGDPVRITATPYAWRDPAKLPRRHWIYGRQLLRGTVALVVAPGATGKTALLIGTAMALVTGRALFDKEVWDEPKRVWIWNLEDSSDELARLIQAAALHWRITEQDVGGRLFVDSGLDGAEIKIAVEEREGVRIVVPVVDALISELKARQIDVLVIDPFVSSHGVNENDNGAIDAVAKMWARIAVLADCCIILSHHTRKLGGVEANAESARGAKSLVDAARSALVLNRMTSEEAEGYGIDGEERRRFFRAYDDKPNRAPPSDASDWYRLASVSLGNGLGGGPGDSLQVVLPWAPPQPFDGVNVDDLRRVQAKVAAGEWRSDPQTSSWVGVAVADVLDLDLFKPSDKKRIGKLLKEWVSTGALRIEQQRDELTRKMKPFVVVGRAVDDMPAPPSRAEVAQGGAVARPTCATTTPHKRGVGGGAPGVGSGNGWRNGSAILAPDDIADGGTGGLDGWPE